MPEERDEARRRCRLLRWVVGRLQQPLEERKHGTGSKRFASARRRHPWRRERGPHSLDRIGCGRVENLRVGTMTPGLIWLVLCNYCRFATIARLTPSPRARVARGGRARAKERPLFLRRDAENPTQGTVGGEPQRAVRPVANIA